MLTQTQIIRILFRVIVSVVSGIVLGIIYILGWLFNKRD